MNPAYVLIFWLVSNPNMIPATGTARFLDQTSCEGAHRALNTRWANSYQQDVGVCLPEATDASAISVSPATPAAPTTPAATVTPPLTPAQTACASMRARGIISSNGAC